MLEEKDLIYLKDLINQYIRPFGAMSKTEFDINLFMALQDADYFENGNKDCYSIIRKLGVTKSKARNLIYAAELRRERNDDNLKAELKEVLKEKCHFYEKDSRNIAIEINDPLLIDFLQKELKSKGFLIERIVANDLVKMSIDAYRTLLEDYLYDVSETIKKIENVLIEIGAIQEKSLAGVLLKITQLAARKIGGKALEDIVGDSYDMLNTILKGKGKELLNWISDNKETLKKSLNK